MDGIEALVEKHAGEIHAYLCRMTGDYATAKDILSLTFLKLVEEFRKKAYPPDICRAWLYKVATNFAISHGRKQKIRRLFGMKFEVSEERAPGPDDIYEQREDIERLRSAIEKLPVKQRSVLVMNVYQELSYEDIAKALNLNIGTVKSRINEAKKRIATLMEVEK